MQISMPRVRELFRQPARTLAKRLEHGSAAATAARTLAQRLTVESVIRSLPRVFAPRRERERERETLSVLQIHIHLALCFVGLVGNTHTHI